MFLVWITIRLNKTQATEDRNNTTDHIDLTGIYKTPSQVSTECLPGESTCWAKK